MIPNGCQTGVPPVFRYFFCICARPPGAAKAFVPSAFQPGIPRGHRSACRTGGLFHAQRGVTHRAPCSIAHEGPSLGHMACAVERTELVGDALARLAYEDEAILHSAFTTVPEVLPVVRSLHQGSDDCFAPAFMRSVQGYKADGSVKGLHSATECIRPDKPRPGGQRARRGEKAMVPILYR